MTNLSGKEGNNHEDAAEGDTDHLNAIPDGAGCVEIWEKISEACAADDN